MTDLTRRAVGRGLAASTALIVAGKPVAAMAAPQRRTFPRGFRWGAATAAYQIEGAVKEDGRGESIWDVFSHTPGKISDGTNGDTACDSYHLYRQDTALLKQLGATAYRFSISWPRIFPDGRGRINAKGLDHYDRMIDDLLENGIEPYVTLFHWDLPSALAGGWQNRDTAQAFAEYAGLVAGRLSDRVTHFMTTNEFRSFIDEGYGSGQHAPGLKLKRGALNQTRHHALLAHGLGVQAIRASAHRKVRIGLAENPLIPVPAIEAPDYIAAAKSAFRLMNAGYLTAVMEGRYPDAYLQSEAANAPMFSDEDMRAIGSPIDFVGINYYGPLYVRPEIRSPTGYAVIPPPRSFPRMVLPWLTIGPEGAYWAVRLTTEAWHPKAIFISENGCVADDRPINGRVDDTDRIMFLRNYMTHLQRATAEGYPLKGYFAWSLMDNFEWAEGYAKRFGLHFTDFETQRRTPKLSATWYRELIARNALV